MRPLTRARLFTTFLCVGACGAATASAQVVEAVGTRALGMGGAFVAVANDSSATWWNPAGLAAGPFLDVAVGWSAAAADERIPAVRLGASSVSAATPPFGISYYRLRVTDIRPLDPTGQDRADREDRRAGFSVRSLSVTQLGATILHTLFTGVHVGTTVKYVRGTPRGFVVDGTDLALIHVPTLLDEGADLDDGEGRGTVDVDAGILAAAGAIRAGAVVRNLREPEFDGIRLPRQVRAGAAYDGDAAGVGPFVLAIDADLRRYDAGSGDRRVIAVGGEHWLWSRRVGVRGGGRFNTVGATDEAVTAGVSAAPRAGMYVDGYAVWGSAGAEDGWGVALRVSF